MTVKYTTYGASIEVRTDGRSICDGFGECLITRAHDGFLALINGKRYGRHKTEQWLIYALTERLAKAGIQSEVVQASQVPPYVIDVEQIEIWWRAQRA